MRFPTLVKTYWRDPATHWRVWGIAAPMSLSNMTVPLVALVDSAVAGHLPHTSQLGSIAVGGQLYTLVVWMTSFLRMGTTGFAAQASGKGNQDELRQVLFQGLSLALLLTGMVVLISIPILPLTLGLMRSSASLETLTREYFQIRLAGLPGALISFVLVGWFLGKQKARVPLTLLVATNTGNIVLNLWLVIGLGWGVPGAALASVVAEWFGAGLGLSLARVELGRSKGRIEWNRLRRISAWMPLLRVNRDIFIRTLALEIVFFSLTMQGARLGDATVAANALLLNGSLLASNILDGLAQAAEALFGHAIGARDRLDLYRSLTIIAGWSFPASLLFAIFFGLAGRWFVDLQTNLPEVREIAYQSLPFLAMLPLFGVSSYLLDGVFIGATRSREMRNAMLVSTLIYLLCLWPLYRFGNEGLWIAFLVFLLARACTLGFLFRQISRRDAWWPEDRDALRRS